MAKKRGLVATHLDRLIARQLGLPRETCSYTTTPTRIPISTSTETFELAADIYQPLLAQDQKAAGTILIRCPYGRSLLFALLGARPYAARGYNCLFVSCRGTFGSGGKFAPWQNEEEDGKAVIEWMRQQSWYTGSFATLGGSYLGYVQWALLKDPPSDMVAAVIQCAPHNFGQQLWGTGSLSLEWVAWADNVLHQEETGIGNMRRRWSTMKRMQPMMRGPDLAKSIKHHFDGQAPWMEYVVDHLDIDTREPFYEKMNFEQALERASVPILLVGGWYDVFAPQTTQQYTRLSEHNTNVSLMMGPWNHTQVGMQAEVYKQSYNWIEQHLAKRSVQAQKSPIQYFVTGAKEWRHEATWPPPTVVLQWYLGSDQRLTTEKATQEGSSAFFFDPKDPTPIVGGNLLLLGGGSTDDTALAARSDVLTFTTEPLENDVEVAGEIIVQLNHASDNLDVDLLVRVSEVDAKGRSHNITETYRRLSATSKAQTLVLHLNDCAHRFKKGFRIRLLIAGASFPQHAVNDGRGVGDSSVQWKNVIHTVRYGGESASKILLLVAA
ncbi:unnamed protein product [Alternaria alternata]